jgi:hypothetical protein
LYYIALLGLKVYEHIVKLGFILGDLETEIWAETMSLLSQVHRSPAGCSKSWSWWLVHVEIHWLEWCTRCVPKF